MQTEACLGKLFTAPGFSLIVFLEQVRLTGFPWLGSGHLCFLVFCQCGGRRRNELMLFAFCQSGVWWQVQKQQCSCLTCPSSCPCGVSMAGSPFA